MTRRARTARSARWRFDVDLLGARVVAAVDQLDRDDDLRGVPVGGFGAGTRRRRKLSARSLSTVQAPR